MPRGGSVKGAPRGNAKKRLVEPETNSQEAQSDFCEPIKTSPELDPPFDLDLHDLGKSPLDE